jgi:hypothetical protein
MNYYFVNSCNSDFTTVVIPSEARNQLSSCNDRTHNRCHSEQSEESAVPLQTVVIPNEARNPPSSYNRLSFRAKRGICCPPTTIVIPSVARNLLSPYNRLSFRAKRGICCPPTTIVIPSEARNLLSSYNRCHSERSEESAIFLQPLSFRAKRGICCSSDQTKTYLRAATGSRNPASLASFPALSVPSHVKSGSLRPKCP